VPVPPRSAAQRVAACGTPAQGTQAPASHSGVAPLQSASVRQAAQAEGVPVQNVEAPLPVHVAPAPHLHCLALHVSDKPAGHAAPQDAHCPAALVDWQPGTPDVSQQS
jgi:hypothetical protein